MTSTRRKFFSDCSAISAVMLLTPSGILARSISSSAASKPKSLEEISCSMFARLVNTPFRILASPAKTVEVTLVEVRLRPDVPVPPGQLPSPDADNEKFSLFFSGPRSELLQQNTYAFEHDVLGRFALFIVPLVTRNPEMIEYQMVFNRPRLSTPL